MTVTLTIIKYKKIFIPFAILAMALHRIPLYFNNKISFWKLMGSGKNGSFDLKPDLQQWAILLVSKKEILKPEKKISTQYGLFILKWFKFFKCKTVTYLLEPIEGYGLWNGKNVFGCLPKKTEYDGTVAVLTRATIRISKLKSFWKNVDGVAKQTKNAKGLIKSYGIGEIPFIKQATFSIWQNKEAIKKFAYQMSAHKNVIEKTKKQNWYSEEMFVRFKIIDCIDELNRPKILNDLA